MSDNNPLLSYLTQYHQNGTSSASSRSPSRSPSPSPQPPPAPSLLPPPSPSTSSTSLLPPPPPPPPPPAPISLKLTLRPPAPPPKSPSSELPQIHHDLVPLSFVVERVASNAFDLLKDLLDVLPSKDDDEKKRLIVDYVLNTRRQLLKLLVLVRWSKDAGSVRKCMNLIGFLTHQNSLLDNSLSSLLNVSSSLSTARVRNYDLPTSISVLTTGTYTGLPSSIQSRFTSSPSGQAGLLTDSIVIQTLKDVNEVLRWRLGGGLEKLPKIGRGGGGWSIEDGRVWFKVEGMWEASFTYSGEGKEKDEEGEWYLLSLKFLFRVGDEKGSWAPTPKGPMKDHLIEICNRILAKRRPTPPPASTDPQLPPPIPEASTEKTGPDHPLLRAYAFLQNLSLQYQLESLHSQALALQRSLWAGSLRVELVTTQLLVVGGTSGGQSVVDKGKGKGKEKDVGKSKSTGKRRERRELRVEYWTPPPPLKPLSRAIPAGSTSTSTSQPSGSSSTPLPTSPHSQGSGVLSISFVAPSFSTSPTPVQPTTGPSSKKSEKDKEKDKTGGGGVGEETDASGMGGEEGGKDRDREREKERWRTLEKLLSGERVDEEGEEEEEEEVVEELEVEWKAEVVDWGLKEEVGRKGLGEALSLETLLLKATSIHAKESIKLLYERLVNDLGEDDIEFVQEDSSVSASKDETTTTSTSNPVPTLRIHLFGPHWLLASISPLTGKLELSAIGEVGAMREARLRNAAEKVDKDRRVAGETLLRVRASTIVDEVDSRASFLGLRTVRRLALRQHDWSKFGSATRSFLFVHLAGLNNYYLVLVLQQDGFKFALIGVKEMADGVQSWLSIEELGWLDKSSSGGGLAGEEGKWDAARGEDGGPSFGFDVSIEDLRDLHLYCVRRIAFFKIEQQLHIRCIPFQSVASFTPTASPTGSPISPPGTIAPSFARPRMLSNASPYLVIQSTDLLRSAARVAYPNIAIQCFLVDGLVKTTLNVRFRDLGMVTTDPTELPSNVAFDPKTSVVTFTSDDITSCVPAFLTAYSIVARSIVLALHRSSQASQLGKRARDPGQGEEGGSG